MTVVSRWSRQQLAAGRNGLLEVYAEAMGVDLRVARSRRSIVTSHLDRTGLRAVAAHDEDRLVGVAYGYIGQPGQWWHDQVQTAMSPATAAQWLTGAFEVCELHVSPSHQSAGVGRELLDTLLEGPVAATAVLTTPDVESRARTFYRAAGWVDLVRDLHFPGDPRAFAVLGLALG